jgi:signal transduction histidine kinase
VNLGAIPDSGSEIGPNIRTDIVMTDQEKIQQLEQQLQMLDQQLMQTQKLSSVGALASSITHEFNNILTTVINYAKMGVRHKDAKTRDKAFDRILSAGQRATKITTGMLAYARNTSDRFEPCELNKLLSDVMVLVQKDLQMHRIGVDENIQPGVWALVNSSQIQQILMNLIVNARQSMDEGGRLRLAIRDNPEDGWAEVSVGDSGCGIPNEQLQKIFDPFFTTKKTDARGQGGTGIGLSLCRRIIEAHKGRIRVESEVGKGTTFTLKLPRSESPAGLIDTSAA